MSKKLANGNWDITPSVEEIAAAMSNNPSAHNMDQAKIIELGQDGFKALVKSKIEAVNWKESKEPNPEFKLKFIASAAKEIINQLS